MTQTAGGNIKEPTTAIHIRVVGTNGTPTLFKDRPVAISKKMDISIIGMDVIKYFSTQFKSGMVVHFAFDENSPPPLRSANA